MSHPQSNALASVDARTNLAKTNALELLIFSVAGHPETYGINVAKVREVVKKFDDQIEHPDVFHPLIYGLATIRGNRIPIVSIVSWLHPGSASEDDTIAICEFNRKTIGFLVHKNKLNMLRRNWDEVVDNAFQTGVQKINKITKDVSGGNVYILDVEGLLAEVFPDEPIETSVRPSKRPLRILIAEDSKVAERPFREYFAEIGFEDFQIFHDGKKLLDYCKSHSPAGVDLIVTDLEMAYTSGYTVIRDLKANQNWAHVPIYVNSSADNADNIRQVMGMGAAGFIAKTDRQAIAKVVDQFLKLSAPD